MQGQILNTIFSNGELAVNHPAVETTSKHHTTPLPCVSPAGLAPYYEHICGELGWQLDQSKLSDMQASNAKQLQELEDKIKDAEENLGETEASNSFAHAQFDMLCSCNKPSRHLTSRLHIVICMIEQSCSCSNCIGCWG